jgi:hypothetical protein
MYDPNGRWRGTMYLGEGSEADLITFCMARTSGSTSRRTPHTYQMAFQPLSLHPKLLLEVEGSVSRESPQLRHICIAAILSHPAFENFASRCFLR